MLSVGHPLLPIFFASPGNAQPQSVLMPLRDATQLEDDADSVAFVDWSQACFSNEF
uniref:Uncharacterized protein n=1 Tax=Ralstonia syzygii R24 TaxID=907261 RepID=G3A7T5_9RALS|nr:hypothetical protein RALSY_40798 [Ralstonia syzygii R24]